MLSKVYAWTVTKSYSTYFSFDIKSCMRETLLMWTCKLKLKWFTSQHTSLFYDLEVDICSNDSTQGMVMGTVSPSNLSKPKGALELTWYMHDFFSYS